MADFQLKNMYNKETVLEFANRIKSGFPEFDVQNFTDSVIDSNWENLELKERMHHITVKMHEFIPKSYLESIELLLHVSEGMSGFEAMVLPDFVETYGLADYNISIKALEVFTKLCSSEFAIRQFILKYPNETMEQMLAWSECPNFHVRRLASEGCRPRLPWAVALPEFKKNPAPILPILENLKDDPEEYVRRSVANNLNDISKDNPDLVLDIAEKWFGANRNRDKIIKHALRTLLKSGNVRALRLFGFEDPAVFKLIDFKLDKENITLGDSVNMHFAIKNTSDKSTKLRAEYSIEFSKAKGKTSTKVFQIVEKVLKAGEEYSATRKFTFKHYTTRKLYPGVQKFTIILNGLPFAEKSLQLDF